MMQLSSVFLLISWASNVLSFGVKSEGGRFVVDTDTEMQVHVTPDGSIHNLAYAGTPYMQNSGHRARRHSGAFGSGLSGTKMTHRMIGDDTILFEFSGKTVYTGRLKGYYVFRKGESRIYIGVKPENVEQELRYMFRLDIATFPHSVNVASDTRQGIHLETGDIVLRDDGASRSKFYSALPLKYDHFFGLDGIGKHGLYFAHTSHSTEGMSGGPFQKDIRCQLSRKGIELSAYFYSGHSMVEAPRNVLMWTTVFVGNRPTTKPNLGFLDTLGIEDHVPERKRGCLRGSVENRQSLGKDCSRSRDYYTAMKADDANSIGTTPLYDPDFQMAPSSDKSVNRLRPRDAGSNSSEYTVVLSNKRAQFWSDATDGTFAIEGIVPGTYNQTLYEDQRAVATQSVTIEVGDCSHNTMKVPNMPLPIWSIGCYDGRPAGFRNADKIERKHPRDKAMAAWDRATVYNLDSRPPVADFPMVQIYKLPPTTVQFTLTPDQAAMPRTLIVAITHEYYGGRPIVTINGHKQRDPSPPPPVVSFGRSLPMARTFTHGAFNKILREYRFEARFKAGLNTIVLNVKGTSGGNAGIYTNPNVI